MRYEIFWVVILIFLNMTLSISTGDEWWEREREQVKFLFDLIKKTFSDFFWLNWSFLLHIDRQIPIWRWEKQSLSQNKRVLHIGRENVQQEKESLELQITSWKTSPFFARRFFHINPFRIISRIRKNIDSLEDQKHHVHFIWNFQRTSFAKTQNSSGAADS